MIQINNNKENIYNIFNNEKIVYYNKFNTKENIEIIDNIFDKYESIEIFKKLIKEILEDKEINYNLLKIIEWNIYNYKNYYTKIIFDTIYETTKEIKKKIIEKVKNKIFTIEEYLEEYNTYCMKTNKLLKLIYVKNNETKYNIISTIRNIIYYYEILKDIKEILNEEIKKNINKLSIENILNITIHIEKYKNFEYILKNNYEAEIYNIKKIDINEEIIKKIIEYLEKLNKNYKENKEEINKIMKIINKNIEIYIEKYKEKLITRIKEKKYENIKEEKKILDLFLMNNENYKDIKMMYNYVYDIIDSEKMNKKYDEENEKNKKYINIRKNDIYEEQKKITYDIKLSPEYMSEIEKYNKKYKEIYEHKKLKWDLINGEAIIKFNEKYYIKMLNIQYHVLNMIYEKEKISALEISEKLEISLNLIGDILNSLINAKMILYEENESFEDPMMRFWINAEFEYEEKNISIIELLEYFSLKNKEEKKEYALGKKNILKARIIKVLKTNSTESFNYEELKKKCQEKIEFEIEKKIFDESLKYCKENEYLDEKWEKIRGENDNINLIKVYKYDI